MVDTFIVKADKVEVRKVTEEVKTIKAKDENKEDTIYRYLEVAFEDESGDRHTFKDKAVEEHKDLYHRGDIGTLYLSIITEDVSKEGTTFVQEKTKVLIHDFKPDEK